MVFYDLTNRPFDELTNSRLFVTFLILFPLFSFLIPINPRQSKKTLTPSGRPGLQCKNKKALPRFYGEASAFNIKKKQMLMVMFAILLGCIDGSFDDAVGHTDA